MFHLFAVGWGFDHWGWCLLGRKKRKPLEIFSCRKRSIIYIMWVLVSVRLTLLQVVCAPRKSSEIISKQFKDQKSLWVNLIPLCLHLHGRPKYQWYHSEHNHYVEFVVISWISFYHFFTQHKHTKRIKISLYNFGSIIPLKVDIRYSRSGLFVQRLRKYVDFSSISLYGNGAANLWCISLLDFKGKDLLLYFECHTFHFSKGIFQTWSAKPLQFKSFVEPFFFFVLSCHQNVLPHIQLNIKYTRKPSTAWF